MSHGPAETVEITISFTEQQMELIHKLAEQAGKPPAQAVAAAVEEFIEKEGGRYSR